jgi:hypothetical protein
MREGVGCRVWGGTCGRWGSRGGGLTHAFPPSSGSGCLFILSERSLFLPRRTRATLLEEAFGRAHLRRSRVVRPRLCHFSWLLLGWP